MPPKLSGPPAASGSQNVDGSVPGKATNRMKVFVEPIYGFV
jgi:hypothetical protein